MSNNNFKDDFEKNRQSINPDEHQTELKEDDKKIGRASCRERV